MDMKRHSPAHFNPCMECKPIPQRVEIEEPEDPRTNDLIILPSEKRLMSHFMSHYAAFIESVNNDIEESFLLTQTDRIFLYSIYCDNWGKP